MGSFGDRLKKEREQRGITLDDISLNTKIGTRLLRALEEEKFEQLPGGIFNKGFVRAYARHVGLDEDQTVADYMTAAGANPPQPDQAVSFPVQVPQDRRPAPVPDWRVRAVGESSRRAAAADIPWGILAIVLLVVALALASWSYFHRPPEIEKTKVAPAPASEVTPASASAPEPDTHPAPPPEKTEPAPKSNNAAPANPIPTTEQMRSQPSTISPAGLQTSVPVSNASANGGMFTVRVKGNDDSEECWVSIVADAQPPVEATLSAPYEKVVQARNQVVVKAGNVGALDIYFNGKKLPSQGEYGTVKTFVFHPEGLQPSAPKSETTARYKSETTAR
jgi:cytoskeleton protein RodZ